MTVQAGSVLGIVFWLIAIVALLALIVSWVWRRDVLFPPAVVAFQWVIVLVAYAFLNDRFIVVSSEVWVLVGTGLAAFVLGGITVTHAFREKGQSQFVSSLSTVNWGLTRAGIFVASVGLPFFVMAAYRLALEGPTSNLAVNLRIAYVEGQTGSLDLYGYLAPIAFAATCAAVAADRAIRCRTFWLTLGCVISVGYTLLATGRTAVLFFVFMVLGVAVIRRSISPARVVTVLLISVALLWILVGVVLGKGLSGNSEQPWDVASDLMRNFWEYLLAGLPAFGVRVDEGSSFELGTHTFRTLLVIGQAIGLEVSPPSLVQEYVSVPMQTNVYTVHEPYFRDFSVYGVVISQFLFGALHTFFYEKAMRGSVRSQIMYAAFLFPACMQFFQDYYASLLSLWIQVFVVATVVTSFWGGRVYRAGDRVPVASGEWAR